MRNIERFQAASPLPFHDVGSGQPIVLIHGWALDSEMWTPQVAALAAEFRVLRMDRSGFGASSSPPSLLRDVEAVGAHLEALDLTDVAVVGMSQGARIALALAQAMPSRIACLVLDGAPFEVDGHGSESEVPLAQYREVLDELGVEALRTRLRQHPFMRLRTPRPETQVILQRMISRYGGHDLRLPVTSILHRIELIKTPALVLNGEFDSPVRCAMGDALSTALPLCERAIVRNAGHLANLDNPCEYSELLVSFIRRHPRS